MALIDPVKLAEVVSRAWCHKKNSGKAMDPDLVNAIVKELLASDLRLLAEYSEAAWAYIEARKKAPLITDQRVAPGRIRRALNKMFEAADRHDTAREALVAAGIRLGD